MDDNTNMALRYEREIPEGYEARIEGNKVILEPKEGEDERIRKDIINLIEFALKDGSAVSPGSRTTKEEALAYLEKQKEQHHEWSLQDEKNLDEIFCAIRIDSALSEKKQDELISWLQQYRPYMQKEQPTLQIRTGLEWANAIDNACDKRYLEEYSHGEYCHEQSFKWGFQEGVNWLEKRKEQKPRWEINNPYTTKWTRKMIDEKFEELVEPKPAEWSEEDESRLSHAITTLAENVKRGSAREDFEFLASLPRRFNLQPKTEWSEEDERSFDNALSGLKYAYEDLINHKSFDSAEDVKNAFDWLKVLSLSLKKHNEAVDKLCSNEWSEEDERMLCEIIQNVNAYDAYTGTIFQQIEHHDKKINWLKSLCPEQKDVLPSLSEKEIICLKRALDYLRKEHNRYDGEDFTNEIAVLEWLITYPTLVYSSQTHWKPSEEQMKALKIAVDRLIMQYPGRKIALQNLYDDLEKL